MKDKFKKFVRQHWIFIWAFLSVVYVAIVQLLFSLKTSNQFFVAHWGAGDILTYASTISLGLLAMWQNKKQQEENDITQERMERIIIHANELSIISKMIEHEERRVNELDKLLNRFMQNCDPQAVAIAYSSDDKIVCMTQVTELERTIDKDFFAISRLLAEDKVLKLDPDNALKVAFAKLYQTVKKDIGDIRQEKIDMCDIHAVGKMAGKLSAERDTFMKEKEEYLESIQSKLRKLLFEEIALEDARKMYN